MSHWEGCTSLFVELHASSVQCQDGCASVKIVMNVC